MFGPVRDQSINRHAHFCTGRFAFIERAQHRPLLVVDDDIRCDVAIGKRVLDFFDSVLLTKAWLVQAVTDQTTQGGFANAVTGFEMTAISIVFDTPNNIDTGTKLDGVPNAGGGFQRSKQVDFSNPDLGRWPQVLLIKFFENRHLCSTISRLLLAFGKSV